MNTIARLAVALAAIAALNACGGGTAGGPADADGPRIVTGAATKGPLRNATVTFYEVDGAGQPAGEPVATVMTDGTGHFTAALPSGSAFLAMTSGGEYLDESDTEPPLRTITFGDGEGLIALLPANATNLAITPFTHALVLRARLESRDGDFLDRFAAGRALMQQALGVDIVSVLPVDPLNPAGAATAARRYAMLLGGLAYAMNNMAIQLGLPQANWPLLRAIITDLRDGVLDGRLGGGPRVTASLPGTGFVNLPENVRLNDEIARFRNNNFQAYSGTAIARVNESVITGGPLPTVSVADATATEGAGTVGADPVPGEGTPGAAIRDNPGFSANVFDRNDDSSLGPVALGFTVDFFGVVVNELYINNNGNVTFDTSLGTYTPFNLNTTSRQIIAPFFGDVDTGDHGEPVRYGMDTVDGRPAFGVNWIDVDYYNSSTFHGDQLNRFQLVLIDRSDFGPGDFDFELNYGQIRWETGDASSGSGGLGGDSARAGYSNGTGDEGTFFEIPGSAVNGAFLDGNTETGLIYNAIGNRVAGRYRFVVRDGSVRVPAAVHFEVTLSRPIAQSVFVAYSTRDVTALADLDYVPAAGVLTFPPGETRRTISVQLLDDGEPEALETFELLLSNPFNATLDDALAVGSINDDDT